MEVRDLDVFAGQVRHSFGEEDRSAAAKPLEEIRVRSVQRLLEALGRGDLDSFVGEMHPDVDVELHVPHEFPWRLRSRGHQEARALVEYNFATVTGQEREVLNVVAQGNLVVVIARERGRLQGSKAAYDAHFVLEFRFRDDKIDHVRELVAPSRP